MINGEYSNSIKLKTSLKSKILTTIPLVARILRKGIRCGAKITDNIVIFAADNKIFELDLESGIISAGFATEDSSRPLIFSKIEGIKDFTDGIYFGGYKANSDKNPISIYRRIGSDKWDRVYQFPSGSIEHIHNIIADPYKNLVYILTGDFENSAGIWMTDDNFKSVIPVLTGNQQYRGCVGFSTPEGLVYATDSPYHQNSIRILSNKNGIWDSSHLVDIDGPSIYGCQWQNDFVFSTSVEGDGRNQTMSYKLFGKKRGAGVKENYSFIYKGNLKDGFTKIYRIKKDFLPFFLFQFGVLIFASGKNESQFLPVYHMATKENVMNTIFLENNRIN
jgi:hypothetical protein